MFRAACVSTLLLPFQNLLSITEKNRNYHQKLTTEDKIYDPDRKRLSPVQVESNSPRPIDLTRMNVPMYFVIIRKHRHKYDVRKNITLEPNIQL